MSNSTTHGTGYTEMLKRLEYLEYFQRKHESDIGSLQAFKEGLNLDTGYKESVEARIGDLERVTKFLKEDYGDINQIFAGGGGQQSFQIQNLIIRLRQDMNSKVDKAYESLRTLDRKYASELDSLNSVIN